MPNSSETSQTDTGLFSHIEKTKQALASILKGKEKVIELSLTAILAGGHILLEGPPGTGKTSLARGLSQAFGDSFHRIQMTSDLLPSDIVGFLRLKPGTTEFEFRKGPIFTHFLLADELNRSNPKTQSALLEAMAESTVTVDGTTYPLPHPFFVIATQNPLESHGVYPLAESQMDRFMFQLPFDFPDAQDELEIYRQNLGDQPPRIQVGLTLNHILSIRQTIEQIKIEESVLHYLNQLVRGTRTLPEIMGGVSIRGGLHFVSAAKGLAFLRGRKFVTPLEIQDLAEPVLAHRLSFTDGTTGTSEKKRQAILQLLKTIESPR